MVSVETKSNQILHKKRFSHCVSYSGMLQGTKERHSGKCVQLNTRLVTYTGRGTEMTHNKVETTIMFYGIYWQLHMHPHLLKV